MQRLNFLMTERNLKQIDILNLSQELCKKYDVKLNKSDISQYVSGKNEPNQDKLFILSETLNVNVAWLMGFDVPMEKSNTIISYNNSSDTLISETFSKDEKEALNLYKELDIEDRAEIRGTMKGMLKSEKYKTVKNKLHA